MSIKQEAAQRAPALDCPAASTFVDADDGRRADDPRARPLRQSPVPPLTVVHVSGFPTGLRLRAHHSVELKLSNGLTRLGHLVLNFSDRDVARGKSLTGE